MIGFVDVRSSPEGHTVVLTRRHASLRIRRSDREEAPLGFANALRRLMGQSRSGIRSPDLGASGGGAALARGRLRVPDRPGGLLLRRSRARRAQGRRWPRDESSPVRRAGGSGLHWSGTVSHRPPSKLHGVGRHLQGCVARPGERPHLDGGRAQAVRQCNARRAGQAPAQRPELSAARLGRCRPSRAPQVGGGSVGVRQRPTSRQLTAAAD